MSNGFRKFNPQKELRPHRYPSMQPRFKSNIPVPTILVGNVSSLDNVHSNDFKVL